MKKHIMKKQATITKILIHVTAAVIAIAGAAAAGAADPLVAYGDFNNDGLEDVAELTSATTISIGLANPDGTYTQSAILSVPNRQNITGISVGDFNNDGKLDLQAGCPAGGGAWYFHTWLGNGDGTFGSRTTVRWRASRWFI